MISKVAATVSEKVSGIFGSPNSANITLGPIIGEVNFGEARVLVEFDAKQDAILILKNGSIEKEAKASVEANRISLFKFAGIQPGQKYTLHYKDQEIGGFHTVANKDKSDLKFAVISCNSQTELAKMPEEKQLWNDVKNKVQKQSLDQLLHIGDQVYIDHDYYFGDRENNAFGIIEKLVENVELSELGKYTEQAREYVREEYRKTWSLPHIQYVLSHVSNRMLLDDHEVKDDAGKDPELSDRNHWKGWFGFDVARYVYYEYQKRLTEDVDLDNLDAQTHEYQEYILQNSGFFIIDTRGHYLWHGDKWKKEESYLGQKQKQALVDSLKENGKFNNIKSLFIITSIPMVLLGVRITRLGKFAVDDLNQHWEYDHVQELTDILDLLLQWENAKQGRVVSLVAGDVHFGGHYDIYKGNKGVFKQMICSSIGQVEIPKFAEVGFEIAAEIQESIGNGYSFEKHDLVFANNYGIVSVTEDQNGAQVKMGLMSNDKKGFKQERIWGNTQYQTRTTGCCSIF